MSLKDELQSITPEEAQWALMSLFEQERTSLEGGQIEQSIEARSHAAEQAYPGVVSLSNLALQSIARSEVFGTYSNQELGELYAQLIILSLAQIVELREKNNG